MSNGSTVAKRAHANCAQPNCTSALHAQYEARACRQSLAYKCVERVQLRVASDGIVAQQLAHLQQAHLTRYSLAVAQARLCSTSHEWRRAWYTVHRYKRARLRWVAQRRASAMRLSAANLRRRKRRTPKRCEQQRALR